MNIRDPVHGQIEFSPLEAELLDLPALQRLRQIKQVGMTYLVYPGAHHTRFEHSLGTAHLASKMARRLNLGSDEISRLRLAALLHDVGHLPFSHDSEEALSPLLGSHEKIGRKKIEKGEIADALSKNYSPKKISSLAFGSSIGQIITSDVGADRLDYLLRDAHYTGVAYGVIDWGRILAKIAFKKGELQIGNGGLEAAESVILARFSMFHAVYYHHTVRIARKMLQAALKAAAGSRELEAGSIIREGDCSLLLRLSKIPACSKLVSRLRGRKLYKRAASFYWSSLSKGAKKYAKSPQFAADLGEKFPNSLVGLPANFKSDANIKVREGKTARKLSQISSISSSLEAAASERSTLLVIAPRKEKEGAGKLAKKLLGL